MMGSNNGGNPNMAASWPIIVDGQSLLNETSILPHLLHEASEEAQQQQATGHYSSIENEDINNEEQLQNMIENYSKHVIRQKQQQQTGKVAATGRSSSHLQRKINSTQPTPMSHSHPCLLSEAAKGISQEQPKRINTESSNPNQSTNHHSQQYSDPREAQAHQQTQQNVDANGNFKSRHLNGCHQQEQQGHGSFGEQQQPQQNLMHENMQLKQKIETLQRKCDRLEQLELAYRKIERDYEQMLGQHERRDELNRVALQKLEQQLRMLATENEQLRAQNGKIGSFFGQQLKEGDGEPQIHFLLNELIPKNNELMLIQERQRIELDAQNSTLEEQRTHIEVLEKALTNAQERLAAKDRSAVDAVAVVDKCRHLQRMLQEALEDKQRQKEQNGRQVAQLEMELTQLRLQLSKESSSQALGSLGRKGGGTMAANGGSPEAADEMLKLRKALSQKEERIAQLEGSLLQMQRRFGCEDSGELLTGTPKLMMGASRTAELEARAMRLEMEKAEKERRIQELLDDKMRNQMQLNEERRSLEIRVRNLEKDLRHVLGSQSSLASSCGGGHYGFVHADFSEQSPFASIRGQKSSYSQYRSTAELPTSTRVAALCDERTTTGMDVMARMEELGRKLAERRGRPPTTGERTTTVQRPSELGLIHVSAGEQQQQQQQADNQSHSSSTEQPPQYPADMSPGSEEHLLINGGTPLHRQSAPSSAGSSSKKRYLVNAPASQLNAYLEQLPEATRRRLTGERAGAGGFHLLAGIERNPGGLGRREGGCRRLIRDHSVDARKGGLPPPADIPSPLQQLAPPPNYQEAAEQAAQQRREAAPLPPPPLYQQQTQHQQQQLRQLHQMSNIEEPMQEPPPPPSYPQQPQQAAGKTVNVVEIKGEEGDSDTLTGHKQLVFRRGSLGNTNLIAK